MLSNFIRDGSVSCSRNSRDTVDAAVAMVTQDKALETVRYRWIGSARCSSGRNNSNAFSKSYKQQQQFVKPS
jgi:hypothetical protein